MAAITGAHAVTAAANGYGGDGGFGGTTASGAAGGTAKANVTAASTTTGTETVAASATAYAGNGGYATGAGKVGGAGGVASGSTAKATSAGAGSVQVGVNQKSGIGGSGSGGANGGAGGASTLTNAVTGQSNGGSVSLTQTATGGNGGYGYGTDTGGAGGAATSILTDNDTALTTQSAEVYGSIQAYAGAGGGSDSGTGGNGAAAIGNGTIIAGKSVDLYVTALGGNGGSGGSTGAGGAATATGSAAGVSHAVSQIVATGGLGAGSSAKATASATGAGGYAQVTSSAAVAAQGTTGQLVDSARASVSTSLEGNGTIADSAKDVSAVQFGVATPASDTTDQGVAVITGAPTAANVATILAANSTIASAFAVTPSYFGIAEVGGAYTTAGITAETTTSTVSESVDLGQLALRQDLLVGLYGGTLVGTGVTGVTLTIIANGSTVLNQSFTSGAAAKAYFTNNAVDLGSLAGTLYAGNVANISVSLSVTTSGAGSGFYGNLLIGDPPKAASATATAGDTRFGQAASATLGFATRPGLGPIKDFAPTGAAHDTVPFASGAFADWAHLLGATRQGSSDLAVALDPADTIARGHLAQASLSQGIVRHL